MNKISFACSLKMFYFEVDMPLWKSGAPGRGEKFYSGVENRNWKFLTPRAAELFEPILKMLSGGDEGEHIDVDKGCFRVVTGEKRQAALFPKVMRCVCKAVGTNEVNAINIWITLELHKRAYDYIASGW